eukprot:c36856_g1_i1 orf=3-152(-)
MAVGLTFRLPHHASSLSWVEGRHSLILESRLKPPINLWSARCNKLNEVER